MSKQTKFGVIFALFAVTLVTMASAYRGWFLLLLWPALSFAVVSAGYLYFGVRSFGKRPDGTLAPFNSLVLFPYLALVYLSWSLLRLFRKGPAFHELTPAIVIGRRLFAWESPANIHTVIDLTCEFRESRQLRSANRYISFPILDGAPACPIKLLDMLRDLGSPPGRVYIHCAEGHGRTGMVAASLLLWRREADSAEAAIHKVCSCRPGVQLKPEQKECVREIARMLTAI